MKVFISWSGPVSKQVAAALYDWLPLVIQSVQPYMSANDIAAGARWSTDIGSELEASSFGIVCLTRANAAAPWINFEAGALSKSFGEARVVPLLFGMAPRDIPSASPLVQFQAVMADKEGARRLVAGVNLGILESNAGGALDEERLDAMFEALWPKLEMRLAKVELPPEDGDGVPRRDPDEILAEILELVRTQQHVLSDPERLLPRAYLQAASGGGLDLGERTITNLLVRLGQVRVIASKESELAPELLAAIAEVEESLFGLLQRLPISEEDSFATLATATFMRTKAGRAGFMDMLAQLLADRAKGDDLRTIVRRDASDDDPTSDDDPPDTEPPVA